MRLNFEMCMKSAVMTSFLAAPDGDGVLPSVTLGFGQFRLGLASMYPERPEHCLVTPQSKLFHNVNMLNHCEYDQALPIFKSCS